MTGPAAGWIERVVSDRVPIGQALRSLYTVTFHASAAPLSPGLEELIRGPWTWCCARIMIAIFSGELAAWASKDRDTRLQEVPRAPRERLEALRAALPPFPEMGVLNPYCDDQSKADLDALFVQLQQEAPVRWEDVLVDASGLRALLERQLDDWRARREGPVTLAPGVRVMMGETPLTKAAHGQLAKEIAAAFEPGDYDLNKELLKAYGKLHSPRRDVLDALVKLGENAANDEWFSWVAENRDGRKWVEDGVEYIAASGSKRKRWDNLDLRDLRNRAAKIKRLIRLGAQRRP